MNTEWIFPDNWQVMIVALCSVLHQRCAWRLAVLVTGIIFAKGRRTVTSWFRCAGIDRQYKAFYYFIGTIGRKTQIAAIARGTRIIAVRLMPTAVQAFAEKLLPKHFLQLRVIAVKLEKS